MYSIDVLRVPFGPAFRQIRAVDSTAHPRPPAADPGGDETTAEVIGAGMQGKQQPILRVLETKVQAETVQDRVDDFLCDLVALGQEHLSRLDPVDPRSAPWHQALAEIHRQAAGSLGQRRVRLASHG